MFHTKLKVLPQTFYR